MNSPFSGIIFPCLGIMTIDWGDDDDEVVILALGMKTEFDRKQEKNLKLLYNFQQLNDIW